jgi:hypothetical protein
LLNKWKLRYHLHPQSGEVKPSEDQELELVKAERELLKKALQFFAEDAR